VEGDPAAQSIPKKTLKLPYDVAALSLIRVRALLPGIILLLERGEAVVAEPAIRVLLEVIFNVGWIGLDQGKAERFRSDGLLAAEKWFNERKEDGLRSRLSPRTGCGRGSRSVPRGRRSCRLGPMPVTFPLSDKPSSRRTGPIRSVSSDMGVGRHSY